MRHVLPAGQMSLSLVQIAVKAYTGLSASRDSFVHLAATLGMTVAWQLAE